MATESGAFDRACEGLEAATSMSALEARGTIRLALRAAGLDPRNVSGHELRVVAERILPKELAARGVKDAEAVCRRIAEDCAADAQRSPGAAASPDAVFERLARS